MIKEINKILIIQLLLIIVFSQAAVAEQLEKSDKDYFLLRTSLLTHHWSDDPDHNNTQDLIGFEYYTINSGFFGTAHFKNSYSQHSWYFYAGRSYDFKEVSDFMIKGKLTYGIITGYDDEGGRYTSKFNQLGTFPAIVPSICVEYKDTLIEASLLADAGFIITGGIKF